MSPPLTPGALDLAAFLAADTKVRSQHWLAEQLGIRQPSVSAWLRGTCRPEPHRREALKTLTGIPTAAWNLEDEREVFCGMAVVRS